MCEHERLVRVQTGWFCPDCKQTFEERPEKRVMITFLNTEEKEEKPKTAKKTK